MPPLSLKRGCPAGREPGRAPATTRPAGHRGADEDTWPKIYETMIDTMIRLDANLRTYVEKLELPSLIEG